MSAISKCYPAILSNHLWHSIFIFLHVAAYVEDLVEPCFMIFRFLFESDEALQASVSNRIIIYLLTDSTLTPAHDDPSPSQQQPAHLLPYIDTRCCWLWSWVRSRLFCVPAASWHCTAQQTLCSSCFKQLYMELELKTFGIYFYMFTLQTLTNNKWQLNVD